MSCSGAVLGEDFSRAAQEFWQEIPTRYTSRDGLPAEGPRLLQIAADGAVRAFIAGQWFEQRGQRWAATSALASTNNNSFVFPDHTGRRREALLPWREVRQVLEFGSTNLIVTRGGVYADHGQLESLDWPAALQVNQCALSPDGVLFAASSGGLLQRKGQSWTPLEIIDSGGRAWAVRDVLGVGFDSQAQLWFATRAGVGCRTSEGWRFYEGKDGLPWNDFTWIAPGSGGEVWFGTHLGAIRLTDGQWHYRQGPLWLPNDDIRQVAVAPGGNTWFATVGGIGEIARRRMTLRDKAVWYEREIEQYVKRTPFGYVAEAALGIPADRSSANPQDSDNDGLWTAMYGVGECFAYASSKSAQAKERAHKAFEALRFLQKVTQGGEHAPPKGYIARTIRPVEWPDPNIGRLASDRAEQKRDRLWKAYEPRWPKSADGKWFWKSDTSSDELDGHYFFYPLYYDFCADTDAERERVREVVRDITDHLVSHDFLLIDHDGRPTRWGVYGPSYLNRDPDWWPERGLKSLSMLSYLAVAAHVTGDPKYLAASRELIDKHGYAHNAMHPKVQQGPGSGNQSDDEMAFMCFYSLLRCSPDEELKSMIRYSFFRYWVNEAPEMNPFFNFAYAAVNFDASGSSPWGRPSLKPWPRWHEDAMATLYGFPLDRLNWSHHNSHRLDLVELPRVLSNDLDEPDRPRQRGYRVNGKVLPVENRHFNHWNTDPWELDYGANGNELAAGTVFLLPYYMGLFHGFIEPEAK